MKDAGNDLGEAIHQPKPAIKPRLWLLWLVASLACLAILGGSAWFYHHSYRAEAASAAGEANKTVNAFTEHTLQLINQVDAFLHGMRWVYQQTGSIALTERFVDELNFDHSVVENLYLISAEGIIVLAHNPAARNLSVADRGYFQFHQMTPADRLSISPVEMGRVTGKYQFRISRRIDNPDGSFGGLVLATVVPESFTRYYHSLQAGAEQTAVLLGTEDHRPRARIPEPHPDKWATPIETPLWAALAQAPSGTYETTSAFDGIRRLFTYRQVGDLPLVMVVGFSAGDLNDRVVARIGWLWPVAGIITLLFLALTGLAASVLRAQDRLATANAALRDLALFDTLTELPSRILFTDRLDRSLLLAERNQASCALMFLDLDHFKVINDTAGHEAGDQVLREVSLRMVNTVRATDTICRWGGDEFLILIPQSGGRAELIELARRLIAHISEPIVIKGEARRVSASIGIACFPAEGQSPAALHAAADAAMYRAKREGKARVVLAADLGEKDLSNISNGLAAQPIGSALIV